MNRRKELVQEYLETPKKKGVFAITNKINGNMFIGSSVNLDVAYNRHIFTLRMGSHANKQLVEEWKQFGEEAFVYEVLERLDPKEEMPLLLNEQLEKMEQKWIDRLQPRGFSVGPKKQQAGPGM